MDREIAGLVMYRDFEEDSILNQTAGIVRDCREHRSSGEELRNRISAEVRRILDLGTRYAFDRNLWHDYLSFLLITSENPFTLTAEKTGKSEGSVNQLAKNDLKIFLRLYRYDFSKLERETGTNLFSVITNYHSIPKNEQRYNRHVSEKVRGLTDQVERILAEEDTEDAAAERMFAVLTDFYQKYGVGMFGLNQAFRIRQWEGPLTIDPITNTDQVRLDDLVGYELQKKMLRENTEAFVAGRPANNCLLYGDSGTGKSTSIKALINEYYDGGLRMIEIYKHQFKYLSGVISRIKNRNYRFIIYMDDLSFEDFETDYKYLKAVIEGGLETRPDNVLIYATSNRRHLIRETWKDRDDLDMDLHHSDTVEEKLSLAARFGVTIGYINPDKKEYNQIVTKLAERHPEIQLSESELLKKANEWEIGHGGMSGRTAQQFIDALLGQATGKDGETY